MLAHAMRFAVGLVAAVLAVLAYLKFGGGWASWILLLLIFVVGGSIAEWAFRRLATPEIVRADLEDRVRNPPP
jgi:hypothetical protein